MTHVAIARSPYAHARITSIDTTKAAAAPGVVAVFTGKDFEDLPALPCAWQAGGVENFVNTPRALEIDRVTFTGAGVAAVVAETKYAAEDALRLIDVEYEPLDVVVDVEEAAAEGAPQLHENAPGNIVMDWSVGNAEGTDKALAEAEVVVKERLVNQRLIPNPMEARGAAATYEPSTGQYTVWMSSQDPHIMRLLMTAFVFGIPETKMRCIALHVGGGFGTKIFLYHEYVLMAALAEKVGRPVKWVETRSENYTATTHGRDHVAYLEIGANRDGTITALKTKTYANLGGVLSRLPRASRRRSTGGCSPAPTGFRTSTARYWASTRTPAWSTPTAAPGDRRRPTSSSGPSTSLPGSSSSTRSTCGARTSSRLTRSPTTPSAS